MLREDARSRLLRLPLDAHVEADQQRPAEGRGPSPRGVLSAPAGRHKSRVGRAAGGAHTLNAPGKFLISAPGHDTPRRARAYLLTDETVSATASRHAGIRPALDEVSRQAVDQARTDSAQRLPDGQGDTDDDTRGGPETILWAALSLAPGEGISVPDLMDATRMSRPWVYQRLREMAGRGQVAQVGRGRWRTVTEHPQ